MICETISHFYINFQWTFFFFSLQKTLQISHFLLICGFFPANSLSIWVALTTDFLFLTFSPCYWKTLLRTTPIYHSLFNGPIPMVTCNIEGYFLFFFVHYLFLSLMPGDFAFCFYVNFFFFFFCIRYDIGDQTEQSDQRKKLKAWRHNLKALLSQPIEKQFTSGRYPTKEGRLVTPFLEGKYTYCMQLVVLTTEAVQP